MDKIYQSIRKILNASIRRQLILGIALVHAILMTIFVSDLVSRQRSFLSHQSVEHTEALAISLAANSISWVLSDDVIGLEEVVLSQRVYPNIKYAMILSPKGRVLAHTDNSLVGLFVKDSISLSMLEDPPNIKYLVNNADVIDIAVPVFSDLHHIGWSRVAVSQEVLNSGLRKILRDGIGYTLLAILVGSIFAIFMARGITSGIRQLLQVTHRVENGEMDARVKSVRADELGLLGSSFNRMVITLEQLISDQKLTEIELTKLSIAIEQSPVSIVITDLKGDIEYVNQKFISLTGYSRAEAIGQNSRILKSDGESKKYYRNLWTTISTGNVWSGEFHNKKKNGELYWEHARISPIFDNNYKVTHYLAIKEDITLKKQAELDREVLEKQLRQSQKLEAVGTMVGGISHELNNILQSIFLYAGILKDMLPDDKEIQANIEHLLKDGDRAKDIVKQILTFSRKSKADMMLQPIQKLVIGALDLERSAFPANIDIRQDIDMNCDPIICDETQVHQIVINICNNARHAMKDTNGILSVKLHQIPSPVSGDTIELLISDTGQGMDSETLEQIFNPFFTTKEIGKGTGLGLSVVHGLVEKMNGQIDVTSEVDKGTIFQILIPVGETKEDKQPTLKPKAPPTNFKKSILLVDDQDSIRIPTAAVLIRKGFTVTSAIDGKKALELFKANPEKFDIIVTDQSMPNLSGSDLTKEIRNTNSDVPILLSTGQLGVEDKKEYTGIGITGFIQKPWTAEELIAQIQAMDLHI